MEIIDIIAAAGPLSDRIMQITGHDDGTLSIYTEENSFRASLIGQRLVFEAIIDTPFGAHRERILAALLTYNAVWEDTGHIRMALSGVDKMAQAMLVADIILNEAFSAHYVANVIEDLDAKIEIWRGIIAGGADDGSDIFRTENNVRV